MEAEDDRIAATTAALVGLAVVADTYSGDWYAQNDGWGEELPDLSDDET